MKRIHNSKFISAICAVVALFTLLTSSYAYAETLVASGSAVIKANNATSKICDVTKHDTTKYGTIFVNKCLPSVSNFTIKVWMKDTTNSTVLSDKKSITCTGTRAGYWIPLKSGVSFTVNDNVRFYGQKTGASRGIDYTACGYWAFI